MRELLVISPDSFTALGYPTGHPSMSAFLLATLRFNVSDVLSVPRLAADVFSGGCGK